MPPRKEAILPKPRPIPTVVHRSRAPEVFTLAMDADLIAFQGHFPGNPILPGVVQVDWAVRFGTEAYGDLGRFRGIEQLKFQEPVRPGETLELHLGFDPALGRLRFRYLAGAARKSSGVIRFAREVNHPATD